MNYQTIVAAFDTPTHAQAAIEALKAGGFHPDNISVFEKDRVGVRQPGLWQRLFGSGLHQHEADMYNQAIERGGAVVSVRVPDNEVAHATEILDVHRPIDVPDRAITAGIAPAARVEAAAASIAATPNEGDRTAEQEGETVIPLAAEEFSVSKQAVETGRAQVSRVTRQREQLIDELLAHETVGIERAPIGRPVEAMPAIREEGDTIVIPLVEEVLVVERRLFLKEEVHVRRVRTTERHQESVPLRYQEAVVTRLPVEAPAAGESPESGAKVDQSNQE